MVNPRKEFVGEIGKLEIETSPGDDRQTSRKKLQGFVMKDTLKKVMPYLIILIVGFIGAVLYKIVKPKLPTFIVNLLPF